MNSLLENESLNKCWLAGCSIELFKSRTEFCTIDIIDVCQNCKNILELVESRNALISWVGIGQLVLGTARIYKIQVESIYEMAMVLYIKRPVICHKPVRRRRLFSTISTNQPKKSRHNSDKTLERFEPKRRPFDCFDPNLISDYNSIQEEIQEENLLAQIATLDSQTACNSLISLKETIPVWEQLVNDDANDFLPVSADEIQEFSANCAQQITVEVHHSTNGRRRRNNSPLIPTEEDQTKRTRIWEYDINQADIDAILPANDFPMTTNVTNSTNFYVQLAATEPISDSLSELTPFPQKQYVKRSKNRKKPFRDLITELKMPINFDNLDCTLKSRKRDVINNIPKKLHSPLERKIFYKFPAKAENSSNIQRMVLPKMAGCLMNQYQRNLKTTKKSPNAMKLLDEYFNKKPIEDEHLSYDEIRSQPQTIVNIEELDASYVPSNVSQTELTSVIAHTSSAKTNSLSKYVFERDPSCNLSPTEISNEYVSLTSAAESEFTISNSMSDRFVEELNIHGIILQTNNQIEWGPTGLLKKLYHLWNANCVTIDMKIVCHGASRKCAALAFLSLMVLQSAKFQYVVLEKDSGSNTIKNIRPSDFMVNLFQEYLNSNF